MKISLEKYLSGNLALSISPHSKPVMYVKRGRFLMCQWELAYGPKQCNKNAFQMAAQRDAKAETYIVSSVVNVGTHDYL